MEPGTRQDIVQAVNRMGWRVGSRRELRKLPDHLWEGETVDFVASGTYGNGNGLITLTNRRLMFLKDGWTSAKLEDFPVSKISSVQWSTGLALGKLQVFVSGNKAEITNVAKPAGKAISEALRARISDVPQATPAAAPPPPAPMPDHGDMIAKLRELGELREAGILDDAEFAAAKAKLLS